MKPAVIVMLLFSFTLSVAQPTPTYKDEGSAKVWVEGEGWVPVDSSSSSTSSTGPDLGSALSRLIERKAQEAAARRAAQEAARQERATRTTEWNRKATEALLARNYREALRLYREQQKVIDGPNVRAGISETEALIIWSEAKTAAEYRRALKLRPDLFAQDSLDFVAYLESHEHAGQAFAHFADSLTAVETTPGLVSSVSIVDTRNLAPALSKPLEDAISVAYKDSPREVRDEVRKGFQAVMNHDWAVAKAWFEQALIDDPANPALQRLVEAVRSTTARPVATKADQTLPFDEERLFGKEFVKAVYQAALFESKGKNLQSPSDDDIWVMFPDYNKTPSEAGSHPTDTVQVPEEKDVELLFLSGKAKSPDPKVVPASKH